MQLTLSSFVIITGYLVTTLLVSCVLVNGSVSWYSGQQAHNSWAEKAGSALPSPPHSGSEPHHLSVLLPWFHFPENLAEQQQVDGSCSQPSLIYRGPPVSSTLLRLRLGTTSHRNVILNPPRSSLIAVWFHFASLSPGQP